MAKKSSKKSSRKSSCRCPEGSVRITTRGRGRGFVCQSKTTRRGTSFRPFVKAVGCR